LLASLISGQNKLYINENYFVHKLYATDLITITTTTTTKKQQKWQERQRA